MSGGGTTIGPPIDPGTLCDKLTFQTKLASPNPSVVAQLRPRDVLEIQIHNRAIAAVHRAGVAGSIVDNVPALIRCLQQGYKFKGIIMNIKGGIVEIEVVPA